MKASEMTIEQLTELLAIKVMGWILGEICGCSRCQGKRPWLVDRSDDTGYHEDSFDPLHDHNHMALVRAKMREMGWLGYRGWNGVNFYTESWKPGVDAFGHILTKHKDELRAEAEAIAEAIERTSGR